eukprot:m.241386 g.241386  ORF g.241386 m.241386 type:complete len:155 (+) comp15323_c0_seq5:58-522(+)
MSLLYRTLIRLDKGVIEAQGGLDQLEQGLTHLAQHSSVARLDFVPFHGEGFNDLASTLDKSSDHVEGECTYEFTHELRLHFESSQDHRECCNSPEFAEVMRILQQCADKTPNKSIMKVVLHAENTRLFGVKRALLAAAIGIIAGLVLVRTWKST